LRSDLRKVGLTFTQKYILLRGDGRALPTASADSELIGRFQRRAAASADDGGAVAAGQRIVHLFSAVRAV